MDIFGFQNTDTFILRRYCYVRLTQWNQKSSTKAMWQNSPTNVICSDKDLNLQYIPGFRENIKNPEAQIIEQVIVVLIKWIKNTNFET